MYEDAIETNGMTANATAAKPEQVYEIFDQPEYPADRYTIVLNPEDGRHGKYLAFISVSSSGGGYYHDEFSTVAVYSEWRDENLSSITDWEDLPVNVRKLVADLLG